MSTLVAQTISNGTVSTSSANVIQGSAKAWVNYNGSTQSIRASYNVSSVTRNGVGNYVINFTNALPDANYSVASWGAYLGGTNPGFVTQTTTNTTQTTTALAVLTHTTTQAIDFSKVCVSIFR
jgi:hypothetical protein